MNQYAQVADKVPFMNSADVVAALDKLVALVEESDATDKLQEILKIVDQRTDFLTAPASSKYHLSCSRGLLMHSVGVTYRFLSLDEAYGLLEQYRLGSVVKCGLFHDLGKAGQYDVDGKRYVYYTTRAIKSKPGKFEYKRGKELIEMSIPMGSLHFIAVNLSHLWRPSLVEWQAIGYHDGQYVPEGEWVAHSETKLGLALHHADMYQSRVERSWLNNNDH